MKTFILLLIAGIISSCAKTAPSVTAQIVPPGQGQNPETVNEESIKSLTINYWCQLTQIENDYENYDVVWTFDKKTKTGQYTKANDSSATRWKKFSWTIVGQKLTVLAPNGQGKPLFVKMVEFKNNAELAKDMMLWSPVPAQKEAVSADSTTPAVVPIRFIDCDFRN